MESFGELIVRALSQSGGMADAADSKSAAFGRVGSNPTSGTQGLAIYVVSPFLFCIFICNF